MKTTSHKLISICVIIVVLIVGRFSWNTFKPLGDKLTKEQAIAVEHAKVGEVQIIHQDGSKEWVKTPNSQHVAEKIAAEENKIREMEKQFKGQNSRK